MCTCDGSTIRCKKPFLAQIEQLQSSDRADLDVNLKSGPGRSGNRPGSVAYVSLLLGLSAGVLRSSMTEAQRRSVWASLIFLWTARSPLLTGGSKGIGRAIALAFAEHGADLVLAARGLEALERAKQDIAGNRPAAS